LLEFNLSQGELKASLHYWESIRKGRGCEKRFARRSEERFSEKVAIESRGIQSLQARLYIFSGK
jgi:hypothetical protein